MKIKICLSVLIVAFLVKTAVVAESGNKLLLAFSFSFLFGCYILMTVLIFIYNTRERKKIRTDIVLIIKNYDESTFDKFLHPHKNREKEVRMIRTRPDDVD